MNARQKLATLNNILAKIVGSPILPDDCYLAGGTAAYFYFHHRLSIDLDFFLPSHSILIQ